MELGGDHLYPISWKLVKKYGQYEEMFIYTLK